jgi:hypothetical protein
MMDVCLGGGIDTLGITEVAGAAGAGKTQLVLQLLLQSQLPVRLGGLGGGAIYLHADTSNASPALKRLDSLADAFASIHADQQAQRELLKDNIYVTQIDTPDELWETIDVRVPALLNEHRVRRQLHLPISACIRNYTCESCAMFCGAANRSAFWCSTLSVLSTARTLMSPSRHAGPRMGNAHNISHASRPGLSSFQTTLMWLLS